MTGWLRRWLDYLEAERGLTAHIRPQPGATREHIQVSCVDAHGNEVPLLPAPPSSLPAPPPGRRRR